MPKPRRPVDLSRDHARPRSAPAPSCAAVDDHLSQLITPSLFAVGDEYRRLGLRARVLSLPAMLGIVLTMIWRQVPSVSELVRLLEREKIFLVPRQEITHQALSMRLRVLPAALFAQVYDALMPVLHARAAARTRPLPAAVTRAQQHFTQLLAVDGTTLEAVFNKVGLRRPDAYPQPGGTVEALVDLVSKLPVALWCDPNPAANDLRFRERIQAALPPRTLLVMDRGFYAFPFFDWLTTHDHRFIIPARSLSAYEVTAPLTSTPRLRDAVIQLGRYRSNPCSHPVRLIEVQVGATWRRYLTNELNPDILSPADVVDLYGRRWRIEEAFGIVKRLLGLSYLWSGAVNAIELQVWATWILYAVLVDLTDAVAEELDQPLDALSLEMTYRGLYHFATAFARGDATDPVAYLASQPSLGIVKRARPKRDRDRLAALPPELKL
jgi:Transposase DDE domain